VPALRLLAPHLPAAAGRQVMSGLPPRARRALEQALRAEHPELLWSVVVEDDLGAGADRDSPPASGRADDHPIDQAA